MRPPPNEDRTFMAGLNEVKNNEHVLIKSLIRVGVLGDEWEKMNVSFMAIDKDTKDMALDYIKRILEGMRLYNAQVELLTARGEWENLSKEEKILEKTRLIDRDFSKEAAIESRLMIAIHEGAEHFMVTLSKRISSGNDQGAPPRPQQYPPGVPQ